MKAPPSGPRLAMVLVARPEGQLGNRIFQAAAFQAAAWEMGFAVLNPALGPYAEFFPALAEDFFCRPGQGLAMARWRLLFCRTLDALTSRPLHPVWAAGGCTWRLSAVSFFLLLVLLLFFLLLPPPPPPPPPPHNITNNGAQCAAFLNDVSLK